MNAREVPFLDLARLHAAIEAELRIAIDDVIHESSFVGGSFVDAFEAALAQIHGLSFAVGCGSGTDALALALRAAGVGPGDEVIVPSMTFVATAEAVIHVRATPIIVDVQPTDLLIDPLEVARVRTTRTKAVLPVHLYGNVVSPQVIRDWVDSGLIVIEDAAQAILGSHEGVGIGSGGHAACLSFYPAKNLGALGDAGAVLTNDPELSTAVRLYRDHGRTTKYVHEVIGGSSRLDGLQAAVLKAKLGRLPQWTDSRRMVAEEYARLLSAAAMPEVELIPWSSGSVHHLMVASVGSSRRDAVREKLGAAGVATGVHYPVPLSKQPSLAPHWRTCPVSEAAAASILSLPIDPLMHLDDVSYVVAQLHESARLH